MMTFTYFLQVNLLSYCGLVDARISASDKDLPVYDGFIRQKFLKLGKLESSELPIYRKYTHGRVV